MTQTRLNPLNIDFTDIMKKANERTQNLETLSAILHNSVTLSLDGLNDARDMVNALSVVWDRLDEEGRVMLPKDVQTYMSRLEREKQYLNALIGTATVSGLFQMRQYGTDTDADDQIDSTEGRTVIPPTDDSPEITFHGAWNMLNWPNGCWVCCLPEESMMHSGTGADPTAAYRQWIAKRDARVEA